MMAGVSIHLPVFPVAHYLRHFPDIDLRIEVRRKDMAVGAGIAVEYIEVMYLVKEVLLGIGGKDVRHARDRIPNREGP